MPQTRFVLGKAMELGHKIIVVINKIDRPDARLEEVEEEFLELLLELDATDEMCIRDRFSSVYGLRFPYRAASFS